LAENAVSCDWLEFITFRRGTGVRISTLARAELTWFEHPSHVSKGSLRLSYQLAQM
jgi:hypothetical protein